MSSASPTETLRTPLTDLLGVKYPILLAGMNQAAGPRLAAAVTNSGGLGVVGGVGWTPTMLKKQIGFLKKGLNDKDAPFGVDLLLPKVGGSARKTNKDYTDGKLPELVDIIIESGAKLFVSAVGVPPKWVVEKLHAANIPVMNMIGAPKHVKYALAAGADIICAQGGEGGGHTGDVPTSVLIPTVVDLCKGKMSPLNGKPVIVVAAGGIFDGRGLAMALALGASGVWVGSRFVASEESGAPKGHKTAFVKAGFHDTIRTEIYTGRPMRVIKNEYILDWETNRAAESTDLRAKGILPHQSVMQQTKKKGEITMQDRKRWKTYLAGAVIGAIHDVKPASHIINEMVSNAIHTVRRLNKTIAKL